MENVTLTPKEQTRLQVLNSLLAEHMTLDQVSQIRILDPQPTSSAGGPPALRNGPG